jgi:GNAT superfamily N-acetyltransferase
MYNLGVIPTSRKSGAGSLLLQYAFELIRNEGINHVFVDSRIPSYNGSIFREIENIPAEPLFHAAINNYFSANIHSEKAHLDLDPNLRFYMSNGFRPWLIVDNFINDHTSGNKRIICHINLA